jgi:hypothetical protein
VIRAAVFLAFLAAVAPFSYAVYKWVDEKGVTHYSESPPPDGKGEKVELKPSGPAAGAPAAPEMWKQRGEDLHRERVQKERQEERASSREKYDSAARKYNCGRAQRELRVLEQQRPVYTLNSKKEKGYISDEDRAREIDDMKKVIRENCAS